MLEALRGMLEGNVSFLADVKGQSGGRDYRGGGG